MLTSETQGGVKMERKMSQELSHVDLNFDKIPIIHWGWSQDTRNEGQFLFFVFFVCLFVYFLYSTAALNPNTG